MGRNLNNFNAKVTSGKKNHRPYQTELVDSFFFCQICLTFRMNQYAAVDDYVWNTECVMCRNVNELILNENESTKCENKNLYWEIKTKQNETKTKALITLINLNERL